MRITGRNKVQWDACAGFSMPELFIVLLILTVIGAIAIPNVVTVVSDARLRGGASNFSGLLQNCRMLAVKENRTKTAYLTVVGKEPIAYVKNAADSPVMTESDPKVQLGAPLVRVTTPSGPGAPSALTSATLGYTPRTDDLSFGHQGLPCAYSGGICTNYGFIYYFRDSRSHGKSGWAAISISPAGRIKRWFWNGEVWGS